MEHNGQEEIALHRWAVVAEAAGQKLTPAERGTLVRQIAARAHTHPAHADVSVAMLSDRPHVSSLRISYLVVLASERAAACRAECDRYGRGPIAAGCGSCWHRMGVGQAPRSRCRRLRFVRG